MRADRRQVPSREHALEPIDDSSRRHELLLAPKLEQVVSVHQLRLLVAVVDRGGFSRAGEALGLSQPAVSHQLKALATTARMPVLEVVGRKVQLTQAGDLLYAHAKRILAEFEAAGAGLDELGGLGRGSIRMAGDTTVGIYVLPDLLGAFKHAHPAITIRLGVDNRQGVYRRLAANETDFVVSGRLWRNPSIPLIERPFLANELIAIASPRHPFAARTQITLAELAAEPFIIREPGSGTRETTEEAMRAAGLTIQPVMELASNGAIKRAVAQDLGVAIISRFATALEFQVGHLVELPVVGFPLHRQWHLVYPRDKRLGPLDTAFLKFIDEGSWASAIGRPATTD